MESTLIYFIKFKLINYWNIDDQVHDYDLIGCLVEHFVHFQLEFRTFV